MNPVRLALLSLRRLWYRLRLAWHRSLHFRLIALGLTPLLIAFPVVVGVLVLLGGEHASQLMQSNLRSSLAGSRNYLDQLKTDASVRLGQVVQSDRLLQLLHHPADRRELTQLLRSIARGSGLDYLVIVQPSGRVSAASHGEAGRLWLPESHVLRQARIGLTTAAFERFSPQQMQDIAALLPEETRPEARPLEAPGEAEDLLLIQAAAHFPLAADDTDALLVGGIVLNQNFVLLDHMREIIFPVGALPGDAEGRTAILLDDRAIATSRQRHQGESNLGERLSPDIRQTVQEGGQTWIGRVRSGQQSFMAGYEPLLDGEGNRIGMIGAGFPEGPFRQSVSLLIVAVAVLLALTMLSISLLFLRTGRDMTQHLKQIADTMTRVSAGERTARVGLQHRQDDLGRLARHFDTLLDTIERQDQRQQADQKVIADEATRRRALFEHERDGIVVLNAEGRIFEANPKFMQMLGYTPDEFMHLQVSDWDPAYSPEAVQRLLASITAEGLFFETTHLRKDGSTYAAEVSISRARWADTTFWLVLARDISERKQIEAELRAHRINLEQLVEERTLELNNRSEQLNTIFSLSPDGFVSFDRLRRVNLVNGAFQRMTGLSAGEIIGVDEATFASRLDALCRSQSSFPALPALRQALVRRQAAGKGETRRQAIELAAPLNRVLEVGLRLSEAPNVSQILYFRDITHETEVDRMKSEFLSTAAHELRTPMASIFGYSELLLNMEFDEATRQEMLGIIVRQSTLMTSIINELLDLARIEARQGKDFVLERIALDTLVSQIVQGFRPPEGRAAPRIERLEKPLQIRVDRNKLQQALTNVLSNAYKYSPAGGEVTLAYRTSERDGQPCIGLEIRDCGIGMRPEELSRVCERFYRADDSGRIPGTGLGMSIVKEIIELHGGELEMRSTYGSGTTITLWLPQLVPGTQEESAGTPAA